MGMRMLCQVEASHIVASELMLLEHFKTLYEQQVSSAILTTQMLQHVSHPGAIPTLIHQ